MIDDPSYPESALTSFLTMGSSVCLLGIGSTPEMHERQLVDYSDTIDPTIQLKSLALRINDDILITGIKQEPHTIATFSADETRSRNYRELGLNFAGSFKFDHQTPTIKGVPLDCLSVMGLDATVVIDIQISGRINIETGIVELHGGVTGFASTGDAPVYVNRTKILGYKLLAYRHVADPSV